jgi:hypothetical protein
MEKRMIENFSNYVVYENGVIENVKTGRILSTKGSITLYNDEGVAERLSKRQWKERAFNHFQELLDRLVWKVVDIAPDYVVSTDGRVFSLKHQKELKISINNCGYGFVRLNEKKGQPYKNYTVHRLVARAFIPNPHNLPEVEHLDCDKTNANILNLKWSTHKDNCNNPKSIETFRKNPRCKEVLVTLVGYPEYKLRFRSVREACRKLKLTSPPSAARAARGLLKEYGDYYWKYTK